MATPFGDRVAGASGSWRTLIDEVLRELKRPRPANVGLNSVPRESTTQIQAMTKCSLTNNSTYSIRLCSPEHAVEHHIHVLMVVLSCIWTWSRLRLPTALQIVAEQTGSERYQSSGRIRRTAVLPLLERLFTTRRLPKTGRTRREDDREQERVDVSEFRYACWHLERRGVTPTTDFVDMTRA